MTDLRMPSELEQLEAYSMAGPRALQKHYVLGADIESRNIPGDLVECGVCNGGSAAALSLALRQSQRRLWLYDSFEGLPTPGALDGPAAGEFAGQCIGTVDNVKRALDIVGWPEGRRVIRKGWFSDTFMEPLPPEIALLHIDADWYDSCLLALRTFYDRVSDGGIILLDDFGHWEGCREAFYDFIADRHLKPLLERFGHTQAFWVKGRGHNRESSGQWDLP
jgi:O-methyltransferase